MRRVDAGASNKPQIDLEVTLATMDTRETFGAEALLDSGCSKTSVDHDFVRRNRLTTQPAKIVRPIYNADGSLNGHIKEYVELVLTIRDSDGHEHQERRDFPVVNLAGKHDIFLGFDWLELHNPTIDWRTRAVHFLRCPEGCRMHGRIPEQDLAEDHLPIVIDFLGDFGTGEDADYIRAFQSISAKIEQESTKAAAVVIPRQYRAYTDIFEKKEFNKLPPRREWDHKIDLKEGWDRDRKLRGKVYPLNPKEREEMRKFIKENLESGRIRPSNSPIAASFFFVGKKDGGLRPTQDYRRLNDITIKDSYPLPLVSEVITQMRGSEIFSKFDVRWGYNNVRIREGDEFKAAFVTSEGLFEPTVMFFGMTNSPATFQRMMDEVFRDFVRRGVLVIYMDDMCVHTKMLEEH